MGARDSVRRRVSIHAPAWGATLHGDSIHHARGFQFTLPHGERLRVPRMSRATALFQFTLPHGERLTSEREALTRGQFQFTLPHGERLGFGAFHGRAGRFNSRSRMGSDKGDIVRFACAIVSIHAPAWGATAGTGMGGGMDGVSIHAPAWGATREAASRES